MAHLVFNLLPIFFLQNLHSKAISYSKNFLEQINVTNMKLNISWPLFITILSEMASLKLASDHFERSDFLLVSDRIEIQFVNTV